MAAPDTKAVIADSSCFIALCQIRQLELLLTLAPTIVIPSAVRDEIQMSIPELPPWCTVADPTQATSTRILRFSLGLGESAAIALALDRAPRNLVLDDKPARRLAVSLGLPVIGTIGILVRARQAEILKALSPELDKLAAHGFHISPALRKFAIESVGE